MSTSVPQSVALADLTAVDGPAFRPGATSKSVRLMTYRQQTRPFVLKLYRDPAQLNAEALERLIRWRRSLTSEERAKLDHFAAFPLSIVKGPEPVGVLLRCAPGRFLRGPAGRREPAPADRIALDRQGAEDLGHPYIEPPRKLAYVGNLLTALQWLHLRGVIVGDVQPANVLVDLSGHSSDIFLLDCDSVVLDGASPLPHAEPDLWQRPGDGPFDERSDIYKAVLLAARALAEDLATTGFEVADLTDYMSSEHARRVVTVLRSSKDFHVGQAHLLASSWKRAVHADGTMFVSSDEMDLRRWEVPAPGTRDVQASVSSSSGTPSRKSEHRSGWRWLAGTIATAAVVVGGLVVSGTLALPDLGSLGPTASPSAIADVPRDSTPPSVTAGPPKDSTFVPEAAVGVPAELTAASLRWAGTALVATVQVASVTNTTSTDQTYSWTCDRSTDPAAEVVPPGPYLWIDIPADFPGLVQAPASWSHVAADDPASTPQDAYLPAACAVAEPGAAPQPLGTTWASVMVPAGVTLTIPAEVSTLEFVIPTAGLAAGTLPEGGYPATVWGLFFLSDDSTSVASSLPDL